MVRIGTIMTQSRYVFGI